MIQKEKAPKGRFQIHVYVLIFILILISALLTYIVPSGEFERKMVDGKEAIQPETFAFGDPMPIGFLDIFGSIHSGMMQGANIIFFVLIVGGTFGILAQTKALESFIAMLATKMAKREMLLIPVLMLFFAIAGSLMGMSDETIVYVGILVPLAIALGFDAITGFAIVMLGASVGFSAAVMNPFTVGIAQGIAGLPVFSGMVFRIVLFLVLYVTATLFVMRYAKKVKANPTLRFVGNVQPTTTTTQTEKMPKHHKWVMVLFLTNFAVLMFGVLKYQWYITEIAGLFLLFGILMGLAGKLSPNQIADAFIKGAGDLIGGALIIGFAQTILVIFNDAKIIDTILYYVADLLNHVPAMLNAVGMFIFQLGLNFLVPSGSGQAALTMPIMAPLSDMIGVTRQTAVLAFQLGDGMSNIIFPTVGFLMAGLTIAGIPWAKWVRWVFPFMLMQITIAIVALIIAQLIQYGPF